MGISTPELPSITTTGDLVIAGSIMEIDQLAAAVQPTIDALLARGIDKVIALTHLQQLANEKALAQVLRGVDIIVAGGSNTRMGDTNDTVYPGDSPFVEDYPFQTTDADGNPVIIVNVDSDYKYLGRLVVTFNQFGVVVPESLDNTVNGAYASTAANADAAGGTAIPEVVAARDAVLTVVRQQYENVIGHTNVFIEGRREKIRTEETNLGNLSADSMKWYTQNCAEITNVLALKNGGGIRAEIGDAVVTGTVTALNPPSNVGLAVDPGDVSEGHFRGTLRFDNELVVLDATGEEIKLLLEHAVAETAMGATPGQFPQVGGISFSFDPTATALVLSSDQTQVITEGERIRDIWVDTNADFVPDTALYVDGIAQMAATSTRSIVTLNFLAGGGDDYPFVQLTDPNRRDITTLTDCDPGQQNDFSSTGGEQDALAEYFLEFFPDPDNAFDIVETPPAEDRRIQDLSVVGTFTPPE